MPRSVVTIRPLGVEELGEIPAVEQGVGEVSKLHSDWRWEDQEQAVPSAYFDLITAIEFSGYSAVQFLHFSVKEYLTSGPRMSRIGSLPQADMSHNITFLNPLVRP
jgi:hypothetical protein